MLPPTHPGMNNPSPTTSLHPSMFWTCKVVGVTSNIQDLRNFMRRAQHPSMVDASPNTSRDEQSFTNDFIASFDVLDMQSCWCHVEPPRLAQLHAPRATSIDASPNTSRDEQSFTNDFVASFDVLDIQSCWCHLKPPRLAQLHAAAQRFFSWSHCPRHVTYFAA